MPSISLPSSLQKIGILKFELLTYGLRISAQAKRLLESSKGPLRARSGTSGGLDLVLPNEVHVNCPVNERHARKSSLVLDYVNGQLEITRNGDALASARLQPIPEYYGHETTDGVPMVKIGQMCSGDRFCYGMTGPYCWFWKAERRCKYCSIGLNADNDYPTKTVERLLETLEQAVTDPHLPAKHVLIGGGTPHGPDMGAILASELCRAIKARFPISCYVMICAPLNNVYIQMLKDSGADELGMNIEFYSDQAWTKYIPGKKEYIGKKRYFEALEYAVSLFGPINTRSLIIAGLESPEYTIAGAEFLASLGVMPILSPFRPLDGTELEDQSGFHYMEYWRIYEEVHRRIVNYKIPTGPTCICCQNNTLSLPLPGGQYHYY